MDTLINYTSKSFIKLTPALQTPVSQSFSQLPKLSASQVPSCRVSQSISCSTRHSISHPGTQLHSQSVAQSVILSAGQVPSSTVSQSVGCLISHSLSWSEVPNCTVSQYRCSISHSASL